MDRDRERRAFHQRDRDRDYDRHREREHDRNDGYHPARRSPPPRDNFPPRGSAQTANQDSYVPGSSRAGPRRRSRSPPSGMYRRRSRSPAARDGAWRDRGHASPRRGGFSPRQRDDERRPYRDDDRRDGRYQRGAEPPARDARHARSPRRNRSPSPVIHQKRGREFSPGRNRSPPSKRDRISSPPRHHYQTSPGRGHSPPPAPDRLHSGSPHLDVPAAISNRHRSAENNAGYSGQVSGASSRRSSPPPVHPSRMRFVPPDDRTRQSEPRSPAVAARSPPYKRDSPTFDQDYRRERDYNSGGDAGNNSPGGFRNGGHGRGAPPTGPSNLGNGQSGNSQRQRSPHYGRPSNPALSAPSQPRVGRGGGHSRGGGYYGGDGPGGGGGGRGGPPLPSPRSAQRDHPSMPGGGRGSRYDGGGGRGYGPRPDGPPHPSGPAFRGSANSSSTTYPRTQVFNSSRANGNGGGGGGGNPSGGDPSSRRKSAPPASALDRHFSGLPQLEPDGKRFPAAEIDAKARRLEEEAERLRGLIAEKQRAKRAGMRDWNRLRGETASARTRGEFAEEGVRKMNGERNAGGPAF